jgi:hypothetical protein
LRNFLRLVFVCCAAAFLICVPRRLGAQEGASSSREATAPETALAGTSLSGEITSIEVIGLKRTKPHVAQYMLERFIGQDAAALNLDDVYAVVKDSGVLEPVAVELVPAEQGTTLRVTVAEKWTIFPFPMGSIGSGGTSFGLFLLDTNAFGLRDMAGLGGIYGSGGGWMAMAMYNHNPARRGRLGWNGAFMYSSGERQDTDRDKLIYRHYKSERLNVSLGLLYPISRRVAVFAGAGFSKITLVDIANAYNQPKNDVMFLSPSAGFTVRESDWDGFLLSRQSLALEYKFHIALEGDSYHEADASAVYEKSLGPGFRLNLHSGAVWKSGDDPLTEEGPRKSRVDILPGNFSARHYAGFSAGLEKHLFKSKLGDLSVLASWQCVFSRGPISGDEFDHGPSGGVRFYLSRVALPAMGFTVAHNMSSGITQFGFNMGMSF